MLLGEGIVRIKLRYRHIARLLRSTPATRAYVGVLSAMVLQSAIFLGVIGSSIKRSL